MSVEPPHTRRIQTEIINRRVPCEALNRRLPIEIPRRRVLRRIAIETDHKQFPPIGIALALVWH
eukprot:3448855-Pyramimonas_sp.AAC.1